VDDRSSTVDDRSSTENTVYIAGGTDLMVRRSLGLDSALHLIDLSGIGELRSIVADRSADGETLSIGAATTLAELAASPIILSRFPALAEAALSIASPPIRNSATVAGNLLCENRCIYYDQSEAWQAAAGGCLKCGAEVCIATGSTKHCYSVFISDLAPVLISLDARVEVLDHESATRIISKPVEWLYTGDGMNPHTISKRDILTRIVLRIAGEEEHRVFFRKLRPRASVDFTNLTVAMRRTTNGSTTLAASGIGPGPAVLRNTTSNDPDILAASLLKQSQIIDNVSYRRPYRKEMLRETISEGIRRLSSRQ
jgi:4-hydroxybenzoyl-CoA reductase subunit beta